MTSTVASARLPWWLPALVILGAALTAAGGVIALVHPALLLSSGDQMNSAAHLYAHYLVSRNLALAAMLVAALVLRADRALAGLMVLTALIQVLDGILDAVDARWVLVPGLLVFAVAFLVGAARLPGLPPWWRLAG
jgi:hypothetical protein